LLSLFAIYIHPSILSSLTSATFSMTLDYRHEGIPAWSGHVWQRTCAMGISI